MKLNKIIEKIEVNSLRETNSDDEFKKILKEQIEKIIKEKDYEKVIYIGGIKYRMLEDDILGLPLGHLT